MIGEVFGNEKSAAAILYSNKIVIETRNKCDEYTWYSTDRLSVLSPDASHVELGEAIMNHLGLSEEKIASLAEIRQLRQSYRKKAGFKSEKSLVEGAMYVSIYMKENLVRFEPKKNNTSNRMFYNIPEAIEEYNIASDDLETLGRAIRKSWSRCSFIG